MTHPVVSRELVFTRGGNAGGNPDMKAVGESAAGGAANAAAGKKRKIEGGAHRPGGWTLKEEEAVRQACEATKGKPYEVAYEAYKGAAARSMDTFVKRAGLLGYTWHQAVACSVRTGGGAWERTSRGGDQRALHRTSWVNANVQAGA